MVRAILDGRKSQTRRVVTPQPTDGWIFDTPPQFGRITSSHPKKGRFGAFIRRGVSTDFPEMDLVPSPYGMPGDRLYARETWQHSNHPLGPYDEDCDVFYRADYLDDPLGPDLERSPDGIRRPWRPSIHMPRAASRITLDVTGVRVERLQDISEADALAEGIERYSGPLRWGRFIDAITGEPSHSSARDAFFSLWEHLNGAASVAANPWVWVIEFSRVQQ